MDDQEIKMLLEKTRKGTATQEEILQLVEFFEKQVIGMEDILTEVENIKE